MKKYSPEKSSDRLNKVRSCTTRLTDQKNRTLIFGKKLFLSLILVSTACVEAKEFNNNAAELKLHEIIVCNSFRKTIFNIVSS